MESCETIGSYTELAARKLALDMSIPLADAREVLEEFRRAEVGAINRRLAGKLPGDREGQAHE